MTANVALERVDRAARLVGIETVALEAARMALFGPGPGTTAFVMLFVPEGDGVLIRVRSMTGYDRAARPCLVDLVKGWDVVHDVLAWKVHDDGECLVMEGEARCRALELLTDADLGLTIDVLARTARSAYDACPAGADPASSLIEQTTLALADEAAARVHESPRSSASRGAAGGRGRRTARERGPLRRRSGARGARFDVDEDAGTMSAESIDDERRRRGGGEGAQG